MYTVEDEMLDGSTMYILRGGAAESNGGKGFCVFPSISLLGDDGRSYFVCTAALSWTMKKRSG